MREGEMEMVEGVRRRKDNDRGRAQEKKYYGDDGAVEHDDFLSLIPTYLPHFSSFYPSLFLSFFVLHTLCYFLPLCDSP